MKVAILCEFSGVVRDAFIKRGHNAISCDLLPTENPGPHLIADCREKDWSNFDLVIAHPPCTYLCNSGVRWLEGNDERYQLMLEAAEFFNWLLNCNRRVCIENPIMHKHAREKIILGYSQIVQPWMFGHGETKATCLWLKGLPTLKPTNIVEGRVGRIHKMGPSSDRGKLRSITYQGIADAMAKQWDSAVNWRWDDLAR